MLGSHPHAHLKQDMVYLCELFNQHNIALLALIMCPLLLLSCSNWEWRHPEMELSHVLWLRCQKHVLICAWCAQAIPASWLRLFSAPEVNQLLAGGRGGTIDVADMRVHTHYSGGYTASSDTVRLFWKVH